MAVRIRRDGRILCAAMHPAEPGDTYLHDAILSHLSHAAILVTEPMECDGGRGGHAKHGEWWWRTDVPDDVVIEVFGRYFIDGEPCRVPAGTEHDWRDPGDATREAVG